jgi:hypothetical protein
MGSDVFNSQATVGEAFRGTHFQLALGSAGGDGIAGALVQEFSIQYARQVTRVYELGSRNQHYIEGNTQGQMALTQIVGPRDIVDDMLANLSDICRVPQNNMTLSAGAQLCSGETPSTLTAGFCLATSLGISGSVANFIINKSVAIMFTRLDT